MGIIRPLLVVGLLLWSNKAVSERPRPNVITGGNPNKKDVPWPSIGEYRGSTQPPRTTYTPKTAGSTFYKRAAPKNYRYGYYQPSHYCSAHRRTYYDPPGIPSVKQGVSYEDLRRSVQSLAQ